MIVYDIEIKSAVPDKKKPPLPGIKYCAGFHDYENMGIACIGVYDFSEHRYRVFDEQSISEFFQLASSTDVIVSFNGTKFDERVLEYYHPDMFSFQSIFNPAKQYDILMEVWKALGFGMEFRKEFHGGLSLKNFAVANLPPESRKSGDGAVAPILWQRGRYAECIDYCLNDVRVTTLLMNKIMQDGCLFHPVVYKNPRSGRRIQLTRPTQTRSEHYAEQQRR